MTGISPAGRQRIAWVDVARGVGITLVVLGHVLRGLVAASLLPASGAFQFVDAWIYSFHMPLFFFLSGMFCPRSVDRPTGAFLTRALRTIAYPYLVWSLLQTSVQIALSRYTNHPAQASELLRIAWQPVMQFWFFYALFLIFVVVHGLRRLGLSYAAVAATSVALFAVSRWISFGGWGVAYEALYNLPYFALGAAFASRLSGHLANVAPGGAVARAALGFAALSGAVAAGLGATLWVQPILALCGILACLYLAAAWTGRAGFAPVAYAGRHSLAIFVAHTLATAGARITLSAVLGVESVAVHVAVGLAAGLLLPLALAELCARAGFRFAFTWPERPARAPEALAA
jgi:fucose 4-O-acetylase-like acetyltransferase